MNDKVIAFRRKGLAFFFDQALPFIRLDPLSQVRFVVIPDDDRISKSQILHQPDDLPVDESFGSATDRTDLIQPGFVLRNAIGKGRDS